MLSWVSEFVKDTERLKKGKVMLELLKTLS